MIEPAVQVGMDSAAKTLREDGSEEGSVLLNGSRCRIRHSLVSGLRSFHGYDEAVDCGPPLLHRFEVRVLLPRKDKGRGQDEPQVQRVERLPWSYSDDPERVPPSVIPIARLSVAEYPAAWLERGNWSWVDAFDANEVGQGEGRLVSAIHALTEGRDKDEWPVLLEGSAFVYRELHVHPRFRRAKLASQLMQHAMMTLPRCGNDVSFLIAYPIPSIWASREERERHRPAPATDVKRLRSFYSRLGFSPIEPGQKSRRRSRKATPIAMYFEHRYRLPWESSG